MFNNIEEINIDFLKNNCQMIHYFGLGFIQLKLTKQYRLHFYNEILNPIIPEEEIHNHRYDFTSKILKGIFNQELYKLIPGTKYICEKESCQENCIIEENGYECDIELINNNTYHAGSQYFLNHTVFHRVKANNCITLLSRSDYKKDLAEVVRLKEGQKVCAFSKKINENDLWQIIDEMIKN